MGRMWIWDDNTAETSEVTAANPVYVPIPEPGEDPMFTCHAVMDTPDGMRIVVETTQDGQYPAIIVTEPS